MKPSLIPQPPPAPHPSAPHPVGPRKGDTPWKPGLPPPRPLRLAAIGLESEFDLWIDGAHHTPEAVFGDPRAFLLGKTVHRTGGSYALPTGGAVYFDTGVIEVATPVVEVEPHCAARAGRQLWETIGAVRDGLDAWEERTGKEARLVGFSSHYNVSFEATGRGNQHLRTVDHLAAVLVHILPLPLGLLVANRQSTGIGVRPRPGRIEVTCDFTASPALQIAAATLITAVARSTMQWPEYTLAEARRRGIPLVRGLHPVKHTSRKGWLANAEAFGQPPFAAGPDVPRWETEAGQGPVGLRAVARETFRLFWPAIRRLGDPFTRRLLLLFAKGHTPALLDLPERPPAHLDVGRLCRWDDLFPEHLLRRSRYERVLIHAIAGRTLHLGDRTYRPVGLDGWTAVRMIRGDGRRLTVSMDTLADHLDDWERR